MAKGKGISIIVPLTLSGLEKYRAESWEWLRKYWKANLPGAEVTVGSDSTGTPFSKSVAVNDAVRKSKGDILAVLDADAYLSIDSVLRCAREIRLAKTKGHKLWFVPYRKLYRLTEDASRKILDSNPKHPLLVSIDPPETDIINTAIYCGTPVSKIGH